MAASKSYRVTGPCAQLKFKNEEGKDQIQLFYQDAAVPDTVDQDSLDHNIAVGLVSEVGKDGAPVETKSSEKSS